MGIFGLFGSKKKGEGEALASAKEDILARLRRLQNSLRNGFIPNVNNLYRIEKAGGEKSSEYKERKKLLSRAKAEIRASLENLRENIEHLEEMGVRVKLLKTLRSYTINELKKYNALAMLERSKRSQEVMDAATVHMKNALQNIQDMISYAENKL